MFCMQIRLGFPFICLENFKKCQSLLTWIHKVWQWVHYCSCQRRLLFPTFHLAVVVLDKCASQGRRGSCNLVALSGHLEPWALVWESPALLLGDERERADQGEDMWGHHLATTLGTNEQPECSRVHWSLKLGILSARQLIYSLITQPNSESRTECFWVD